MRQIELLYIIYLRNYMGTFDVSCCMFSNVIFSNVIRLVLRDSDTDSENVSLIRCSVTDGQKTCSSKGVSLILYIINYVSMPFVFRWNFSADAE